VVEPVSGPHRLGILGDEPARDRAAEHRDAADRLRPPGPGFGVALLDLNYEEDKAVTVDFNLVATEDGEFVEMQGSGEEATFSSEELEGMLALGRKGIGELIAAQRAVLARIMVSPAAG